MYELIGKSIVWGLGGLFLLVTLVLLIRILLVIWIRIYAYVILGIGVKEEWKKKKFWRLRLLILLLTKSDEILREGLWGNQIIYSYYTIDFDSYVPRIIRK